MPGHYLVLSCTTLHRLRAARDLIYGATGAGAPALDSNLPPEDALISMEESLLKRPQTGLSHQLLRTAHAAWAPYWRIVFEACCENGCISVAERLQLLYRIKVLPSDLVAACGRAGGVRFLQWLIDRFPLCTQDRAGVHAAFLRASSEGRSDILSELQRSFSDLDFHYHNDGAWKSAYCTGQLNVMRWLYYRCRGNQRRFRAGDLLTIPTSSKCCKEWVEIYALREACGW